MYADDDDGAVIKAYYEETEASKQTSLCSVPKCGGSDSRERGLMMALPGIPPNKERCGGPQDFSHATNNSRAIAATDPRKQEMMMDGWIWSSRFAATTTSTG
jgi:hypothetical protein